MFTNERDQQLKHATIDDHVDNSVQTLFYDILINRKFYANQNLPFLYFNKIMIPFFCYVTKFLLLVLPSISQE